MKITTVSDYGLPLGEATIDKRKVCAVTKEEKCIGPIIHADSETIKNDEDYIQEHIVIMDNNARIMTDEEGYNKLSSYLEKKL